MKFEFEVDGNEIVQAVLFFLGFLQFIVGLSLFSCYVITTVFHIEPTHPLPSWIVTIALVNFGIMLIYIFFKLEQQKEK